jgi:hypothetical protein
LNRDALDAVRQADCAILALRRARERDDNRLRLHDHQGIHNARRKPIEAGKKSDDRDCGKRAAYYCVF